MKNNTKYTKYKTLIIFDLDDTLFPTTWYTNTNKTTNKLNQNVILNKLDYIIYYILLTFSKYGKVVIISNASLKWINNVLSKLPTTLKLIISKNIPLLSARDIYSESYPNDLLLWKKKIFKKIVDNYFKNSELQNIISIGDAEYEFEALINLYNNNSINNKRLLKTIRFDRYPNLDTLYEQLIILYNNVNYICLTKKHIDWLFIKS